MNKETIEGYVARDMGSGNVWFYQDMPDKDEQGVFGPQRGDTALLFEDAKSISSIIGQLKGGECKKIRITIEKL